MHDQVIFQGFYFQSANFNMGKAAIPGLGGGVVPPEANITQRTHGSFTCSEVNIILLMNHDIDVDPVIMEQHELVSPYKVGFLYLSHTDYKFYILRSVKYNKHLLWETNTTLETLSNENGVWKGKYN